MGKKEHVPETRDVKANREQRRHPERAQDAALAREPEWEDASPNESQDLASVRTKGSGHGRKTADKWNQ